jgi:hypothetical protein
MVATLLPRRLAATEHLLEVLSRQAEPLGGVRDRPALAERVLDHPSLELLDRLVECPRLTRRLCAYGS